MLSGERGLDTWATRAENEARAAKPRRVLAVAGGTALRRGSRGKHNIARGF